MPEYQSIKICWRLCLKLLEITILANDTETVLFFDHSHSFISMQITVQFYMIVK